MLHQQIVRIVEEAERYVLGADIVVGIGELVAAHLEIELGAVPKTFGVWPVNPFLWGPGLCDVVVCTNVAGYEATTILEATEVVFEQQVVTVTEEVEEIFTVLYGEGMSPGEALLAARAISEI